MRLRIPLMLNLAKIRSYSNAKQLWLKRYMERDQIVRTHIGDLRISAVRATNTLRQAQLKWNMDAQSTTLWGQMMCGTVMLSSFFKGEERAKALWSGNDLGYNAYCEAIYVGEVRGYLKFQDLSDEPKLSNGNAGHFTVSKILYGNAKPYNTHLQASGSIEEDWRHFYKQSEQLPTIVKLEVDMDQTTNKPLFCGGWTIQKIPRPGSGIECSSFETAYQDLDKIVQDCKQFDMSTKMNKDGMIEYLNSIIPNSNIQRSDCTIIPLDYFCRCTKVGFIQQLKSFGPDELKDIVRDKKNLDLTCSFCNTVHSITTKDIQNLINSRY